MTARLVKKLMPSGSGVKDSSAAAILIGSDDRVLEKSGPGEAFAALWENTHEALQQAVQDTRKSGLVSEFHLEVYGDQKAWITAVPQGKNVLLVSRDTELVEKMAEALLESRMLLRGLLDGAVDLSFEIGLDGRFRFVSPAKAFDQNTEEWLGKDAVSIFWPQGNVPSRNPLRTKRKSRFDAVSVAIGNHVPRYLAFNVEPSVNKKGDVTGVQGTCRDVTERIANEQIRRRDHLRVAVQQRITRILNASENAQELLELASRELIDVMRADLVWSVMKYKDGLVPVSLCGERAEVLDLEGIWRELAMSTEGVHEIVGEKRNHLALRLERNGQGIGMVVISRDTEVSPWSPQEHQLLNDVGDILTAAFGKAELIDRLYRLSGKDELTDLLNRRALREVVERRLRHQCRTGRAGCLVFIDLDHFKEVNDTLGHKAGDEAIILVAKKLQSMIRASDYAGRFGGDEFVLWIEDASEEVAAAKAQELLDYMPKVRKRIGNKKLRLGASIGICRSVPGVDLKLDKLSERADDALYEVKKSGRNAIAIAPPLQTEQETES